MSADPMTDAELDRIDANYGFLSSAEALNLCRLTADVRRLRREILAAGTMQEFDWSVLKRLDRLETAEAENAAIKDGWAKAAESAGTAVVALEAENARLRAAMRSIRDTAWGRCHAGEVSRRALDAIEPKEVSRDQ